MSGVVVNNKRGTITIGENTVLLVSSSNDFRTFKSRNTHMQGLSRVRQLF